MSKLKRLLGALTLIFTLALSVVEAQTPIPSLSDVGFEVVDGFTTSTVLTDNAYVVINQFGNTAIVNVQEIYNNVPIDFDSDYDIDKYGVTNELDFTFGTYIVDQLAFGEPSDLYNENMIDPAYKEYRQNWHRQNLRSSWGSSWGQTSQPVYFHEYFQRE